VNGLVVYLIVFATYGVRYTRTRHQIAFVTTIDKHLGLHNDKRRGRVTRILKRDLTDRRSILFYLAQSALIKNFKSAALDVVLENSLGYLRFEDPLFELSVMLADTTVEISRQSTDRVFVPYVCVPESS